MFVCDSRGSTDFKECITVLPIPPPLLPTTFPHLLCPPSLPPPPPSSYKAAQRHIRGAPPLIRVTNWGLARAETPPHLHGHVTFKEVRRVKGYVGGGISLTGQRGRGVKDGEWEATQRLKLHDYLCFYFGRLSTVGQQSLFLFSTLLQPSPKKNCITRLLRYPKSSDVTVNVYQGLT